MKSEIGEIRASEEIQTLGLGFEDFSSTNKNQIEMRRGEGKELA